MRGYAAFGSHRGPSTKAWLVTICLNLARSEGRRRARRPVETQLPSLHDPEAPGVNVPEAVIAATAFAGSLKLVKLSRFSAFAVSA